MARNSTASIFSLSATDFTTPSWVCRVKRFQAVLSSPFTTAVKKARKAMTGPGSASAGAVSGNTRSNDSSKAREKVFILTSLYLHPGRHIAPGLTEFLVQLSVFRFELLHQLPEARGVIQVTGM